MNFAIEPYQSAGPIAFGMRRDEARRALNANWRSFKRTPSAEEPYDHFLDLGVFLYYRTAGIVNAVEFARPANPMLQGAMLLTRKFGQLREFLAARDPNLMVEPDGVTSKKLGIGVYAPDAIDDPDALPESVIAFELGYYD